MRAITKRIAARLLGPPPTQGTTILNMANTKTDCHNVWLHDNRIIATSWYDQDDDRLDNINFTFHAFLDKNGKKQPKNGFVHMDPDGIVPPGPYGRGNAHHNFIHADTARDYDPLLWKKRPIMWFSFAGWPGSTTRERLNGMLESRVYQNNGEQYCNGFHLPSTHEGIWYLDMGKDRPPFEYQLRPWHGDAYGQLVPIGWPTLAAEKWWEENKPAENTIIKHKHNMKGILIG